MTKTQSDFLDACNAYCASHDVYSRQEAHNHCNDVYMTFHSGGFHGPQVASASLVNGKVAYSWGTP